MSRNVKVKLGVKLEFKIQGKIGRDQDYGSG